MSQHPTAPGRRRRVIILALLALLVGYWAWTGVIRLRSQAARGTCLMNIGQLAKAMRLYAVDYNEYLFFDQGDAFSPPLVPGHYGQTRYLIEAMGRYMPNRMIWYCPSDPFTPPDATTTPRPINAMGPYRTFTYRKSGIGYVAVPHSAARDPEIRALHTRLLRDYGTDPMRVDHAWSSFRFIPVCDEKTEGRPAYLDFVGRAKRDIWGGYGYWHINPAVAPVFEEDLAFHFDPTRGIFGARVFGKVYGFRTGYAQFFTHDKPFTGPVYSELNQPF